MGTSLQYRSKSLQETAHLGKLLADSLRKKIPPCVVFLEGPFGAGKTTLLKSVISELASVRQESIASPTFQYVALYERKNGTPLAHFDLWRLPSSESFFFLGLEDIVASSLSFIEWPEKLGEFAPEASLHIRIHPSGTEERSFDIYDRGNILIDSSLVQS